MRVDLEYIPTPKQRLFHESTADECLFGGAAGGGKEIWLGTPIPTSNGFVPMGAIQPGDEVFGRDGKLHTVLRCSEPKVHDAYRFVFDDGAEILCNGEHLWFTYTASDLEKLTKRTDEYRAKRRASRPSRIGGNRTTEQTAGIIRRNREQPMKCSDEPIGSVKTAEEIVRTLYTKTGRRNHAVPVAEPLDLPEHDLPVDPYLLGLWLGDGAASGGTFTTADGLWKAFEDGGYEVHKQKGRYGYGIHGLTAKLREAGVLNNKHVPNEYLWASESQRLSLLQGLMDTDGNCNKNGSAEFTNTNYSLVQAAAFLVRSLGMKCTVRTGEAKLNGVVVSEKYRIKFVPNLPVFRLERKLERQKAEPRRTTRMRYLVSAERVPNIPMRCIAIDSDDHLYLAGEDMVPTHNSKAVVMDALFRCMKWPNTHAYIFRRTYRELEDSIIKEARLSIPNILGRYNSGRHEYHMINGSYIHFRHCESVKDMYQYKGQEIQWLYFDELTTFEYEIYDFLKTRLRAKKSLNMKPIVRCTSNPGDIGHAWVKAHFVDAGPFMQLIPHEYYSETLHKSYTRTTQYIPAFAKENPHISEEYILELEKKPEALRKALLYGEWDAFEGQVFTEFRNDPAHYIDGKNTHVISPFPLNPNWQRYCTFDFGFSKPFAVLWFAQKPDGTLILYREWYGYTGVPNEGVKMTPESIAKGILAREQEEHKEGIHFTRYADPACWDVSRGDSVADQMRRVGVNWNPSDHSRISGKLQIHSRLAFGDDGRPMLQIFSTCPQVIRTLPALPYSRTKPEDIDTDSEDHCLIGSTRVLTDRGWLTIEDLSDTIGYVVSHDGKLHKYSDCRKTQTNVDVFTVTMDDGRSVTATKNHRFMLKDGTWKRLDELQEGDEMMEVSDDKHYQPHDSGVQR